MAKMRRKRRSKAGSVSSQFRKYFEEHPDWLGAGSNDDVIEQWNKDHPNKSADRKIRGVLANLKSNMRKEQREGGKATGQRGRPRKDSARPPVSALESLELSIDRALTEARNQQSSALDDVVDHLRRARNLVVWKIGK